MLLNGAIILELHQIRYFAVLARELNYTKAAKGCYISRQALRQTVQALEREYGVTLVENRHNTLSLTPAGELMAEHAQAVLSACDALDRAMNGFTSEGQVLRLGISISLLPFYAPNLMNLLGRLGEPFPGLQIKHTLADSDVLLKRLAEKTLDAVILVDLGVNYPGLYRAVLQRNPPGLLVSVEHPLAARGSLTLRDLEGQTIALMSAPDTCFQPLVDALREQNVDVSFRIIPESIEAFQAVRREGLLAIDRLEQHDDASMALEIDLPLLDFQYNMETVMLLNKPLTQEKIVLVRYLQKITNVG